MADKDTSPLVQLKTTVEEIAEIDREIVQLTLEKGRLAAEYAERVAEIESKLNRLRSEKHAIMRSDGRG